MKGKLYSDIEINLKEMKESKFFSNMIAEFGIGTAEISCRPTAQVICLVHFLFASEEVDLEANAKKIEFMFG
jgi:hypothetical protein